MPEYEQVNSVPGVNDISNHLIEAQWLPRIVAIPDFGGLPSFMDL